VPLDFLVPAFFLSLSLVAILSPLLVVKRLTRSRAERSSRLRRGRFRAVLRTGSDLELLALAREARRRGSQADLTAALDGESSGLGGARVGRLQDAACKAGLERGLLADLSSPRAVTRGRAVVLMGHLRLPSRLSAIEPLLLDPDPEVRLAAARGIAASRSLDGVLPLLRALRDEAVPAERIIELIGRPWTVSALLLVLESAEFSSLRGEIAEALGLARRPIAAEALHALLETGHDEERVRACRALGRIGGSGVVPALVRALGDDFWPVRAQAARGLKAAGTEAPVEALLAHLGDRSWWVRAHAADALRGMGAGGIEALRGALNHPDRYARERAAEALSLVAASQPGAP
jgi:HEAT repeat protein